MAGTIVAPQPIAVEEGAKILEESDLKFRVATELKEAAEGVVEAVKSAA